MKVTKTYFMLVAADVARGAAFHKKAFVILATAVDTEGNRISVAQESKRS